MQILAIDTAASLCAACVLDAATGVVLGREARDIGKGHSEELMAVVEAALAAAGTTLADLSMIAVNVGPGSFTGVRVGVSAARGFGLALRIPVVGVTSLEALAQEAAAIHPRRTVIVANQAGRDQLYLQRFEADGSTAGPRLAPAAEALDELAGESLVLTGSAAEELASRAGAAIGLASTAATADIATYARIAAARGLPGLAPRPLYLRDAVAKPQEGFALPRRPGA